MQHIEKRYSRDEEQERDVDVACLRGKTATAAHLTATEAEVLTSRAEIATLHGRKQYNQRERRRASQPWTAIVRRGGRSICRDSWSRVD